MYFFDKKIKQLVVIMYYVAGAAMVGMMLITTLDVVLRLAVTIYARTDWAFLEPFQPIVGTYELVCYLGAIAAAFAMAHTSVEGGHVSVSLLVRLFPEKLQTVAKVITESLGLIFFALICWYSIVYALKLKETGEVSMTLQLPVHPFVYGVSFGAFTVCLVLLLSIVDTVKHGGTVR